MQVAAVFPDNDESTAFVDGHIGKVLGMIGIIMNAKNAAQLLSGAAETLRMDVSDRISMTTHPGDDELAALIHRHRRRCGRKRRIAVFVHFQDRRPGCRIGGVNPGVNVQRIASLFPDNDKMAQIIDRNIGIKLRRCRIEGLDLKVILKFQSSLTESLDIDSRLPAAVILPTGDGKIMATECDARSGLIKNAAVIIDPAVIRQAALTERIAIFSRETQGA